MAEIKSAPPSPDLRARKLSRENTLSLRGSKSLPELRNLFYNRTDAGSEGGEQRYLFFQKYSSNLSENTKLINPGESSYSDQTENQNISSKQEKLAPDPEQLRQELTEKKKALIETIRIFDKRATTVNELLSRAIEQKHLRDQIKSWGNMDLTAAGTEIERATFYGRVYYIGDIKTDLETHQIALQEAKEGINDEINKIPPITDSTIGDFDTQHDIREEINEFRSFLRDYAKSWIEDIDTSIDMIGKALQYYERWKPEADSFLQTTIATVLAMAEE